MDPLDLAEFDNLIEEAAHHLGIRELGRVKAAMLTMASKRSIPVLMAAHEVITLAKSGLNLTTVEARCRVR
jgi:hypothetical protein